MNLTNAYVDLGRVVRAQADHFQLTDIVLSSSGDEELGRYACTYALLSRQSAWLSTLDVIGGREEVGAPAASGPLWRDDDSSLLDVLRCSSPELDHDLSRDIARLELCGIPHRLPLGQSQDNLTVLLGRHLYPLVHLDD